MIVRDGGRVGPHSPQSPGVPCCFDKPERLSLSVLVAGDVIPGRHPFIAAPTHFQPPTAVVPTFARRCCCTQALHFAGMPLTTIAQAHVAPPDAAEDDTGAEGAESGAATLPFELPPALRQRSSGFLGRIEAGVRTGVTQAVPSLRYLRRATIQALRRALLPGATMGGGADGNGAIDGNAKEAEAAQLLQRALLELRALRQALRRLQEHDLGCVSARCAVLQ